MESSNAQVIVIGRIHSCGEPCSSPAVPWALRDSRLTARQLIDMQSLFTPETQHGYPYPVQHHP
jgi:hypothetical protein